MRADATGPNEAAAHPTSRTLVAIVLTAMVASGCNSYLGPSRVDSNWHVVESVHFALHVRPGSFAEQNAARLGEVLDDQYEVAQRLLGTRYEMRINAFLYNSADDAKLPSENSGTAFAETNAFEATATAPLGDNLFALVNHEANHVIIIGTLGRPATSLLNEGLASALVSERYTTSGPHFFHGWVRTHRAQVPAIAALSDDNEWPRLDMSAAYTAGASFLAYLLETYGSGKLRQLYYAPSQHFAERFQQIYGRSLATAESDWLAFCEAF